MGCKKSNANSESPSELHGVSGTGINGRPLVFNYSSLGDIATTAEPGLENRSSRRHVQSRLVASEQQMVFALWVTSALAMCVRTVSGESRSSGVEELPPSR